jgi:hypothetical protein
MHYASAIAQSVVGMCWSQLLDLGSYLNALAFQEPWAATSPSL